MKISAVEKYKRHVQSILGICPNFTESDFGSFFERGYGTIEHKGYKFTYSGNIFIVCWDSFLQEFYLYQIFIYKRLIFGKDKVWIRKKRIENILDIE